MPLALFAPIWSFAIESRGTLHSDMAVGDVGGRPGR
jgi:hypothetical protein